MIRDQKGRAFALERTDLEIGVIATPQDITTRVPSLMGMDVIGLGRLVVQLNKERVEIDLPGEYVE